MHATDEELSRYESEGGSTARTGEQQVQRASGGLQPSESDQRGRILLVYAATEPHTGVIADTIAVRLRGHGFAVEVGDATSGTMPPPQDYDVVVLGSPMVLGRETRLIMRYIEQNHRALGEMPSALFTVSGSGKVRDQDPGGFLEEFLRDVDWEPQLAAAFAGGEPFPRAGQMLRLAKLMAERQPAGGAAAYRTDWTDVRSFADAIATELANAATADERSEPHMAGH